MFGLGAATRIYLAPGATDMRKGFNGLYGLVRDQLLRDHLSGHLFLFFECAAQSFEGSFLGYDRSMGVREKAGERPIPPRLAHHPRDSWFLSRLHSSKSSVFSRASSFLLILATSYSAMAAISTGLIAITLRRGFISIHHRTYQT